MEPSHRRVPFWAATARCLKERMPSWWHCRPPKCKTLSPTCVPAAIPPSSCSPRRFPKSLPRDHVHMRSRQYGYLFVAELAAELVQYSDHVLDEGNISEALTEYQRFTALSIAELWSFPLLLRLSLIESLACLVRGVAQ